MAAPGAGGGGALPGESPARPPASGGGGGGVVQCPLPGLRVTKIAVPGNSAPRSGLHWPHS
ncbi:hypothetical protein, partial [Nocardia cyriacigeorgica]|uniref:hypothetical protein n=1 Tax=Nocardia cyriacigeorgica TaxID=135487 RepID=UPI002453D73B